jgi:glycosyltransferase involved in cell wall biosynthesis
MSNLPKISIVTPSFNQGQFLEQTILSVLGQGYPNMEYFIMDGGSGDNSVEIIKKYEDRLTYWSSEKDKGQSNAINLGFERCTGDILCWINSDDYLLPSTLHHIAALLDQKENAILFGNCIHINEGTHHSYASDVVKSFQKHPLEIYDPIIQPSSFWTRGVWEKVGALREDLHFVFDWEWFIRAKIAGVEFIPVESYFSVYRIHEGHKSGSGSNKRFNEISEILELNNPIEVSKAFQTIKSNKSKIENGIKLAQKAHINPFKILQLRFKAFSGIDEKTFYLLKTLAT